ncbi:PrcB C-terminal [Lihuaxuella thermophila]|uniref:PrcB C-terminal n=2 Tax=Lihuaxuella thermophila TaxID=1173111 RepID=A0A1H8ALT0_9BACL|nr:PrcB C-terminal [Lihuaxuella thermophila]
MKGFRMFLILLFLVLIPLTGCGQGNVYPSPSSPREEASDMNEETLAYNKVSLSQLPESLKEKANELQRSSKQETYVGYEDSLAYVMIALGQRKTGGYSIQVNKVTRKGNELIIYAEELTPPKDGFVTQVITNPMTIITVKKKEPIDHVNVRITNQKPSGGT